MFIAVSCYISGPQENTSDEQKWDSVKRTIVNTP